MLESRYLLKDQNNKVIETPSQLFWRTAFNIGMIESIYEYKNAHAFGDGLSLTDLQKNTLKKAFKNLKSEKSLTGDFDSFIDYTTKYAGNTKDIIDKFYKMIRNLEFMPNTPTLMNAGTKLGQLSACFVLPVDDSIESIFNALSNSAKIHKSGGGTGFSFSRLRPRGEMVGSTQGVASGPLSFMTIFDTMTNVIKQGGKRRGANMGILNYNHPEIMDFIRSKDSANTVLSNFNISIGMYDEFFQKLENDEYIELTDKHGNIKSKIKASDMWNAIVDQAWRTGDPGLVFLDEINKRNTVPNLGYIEATNPCGEQPLLPNESCNLGSINLAKFVKNGEIDYDHFREIIHLAVRFLDDVIDANYYPIKDIEKTTRSTRKIGLGLMGFADMLMELGVPYGSTKALTLGENIMKFLEDESHKASEQLSKERGVFPGWKGSYWHSINRYMRNSTTTTIAPTGTISIIAGCSSSIEPIFALAFVRHVLDGQELLEINPTLESKLKELGMYNDDIMLKIAKTGTLQGIPVPDDVKKVFETAQEIDYKWHVLMQAAFQSYCDSGVSKTINMAESATREDISYAYKLAHDLHCKGITIYRNNSKSQQVLYVGTKNKHEKHETPINKEESIDSHSDLLKIGSMDDPNCKSGSCSI